MLWMPQTTSIRYTKLAMSLRESQTDPAYRTDPYVEGSRWLHVWVDTVPFTDLCAVAIQTETVGVRISAAPYVLLTPSETRKLLGLLERLEGCVCQDGKRSIPLD